MNPEHYTSAIVREKKISDSDAPRVLAAITSALDQVYRAVALDIDGTLTSERDVDLI